MSDYFQANFPLQSLSVAESGSNPTRVESNDGSSRELALTVAEAASERKAGDIILLRVADVSYLSDYFVIVTGYSRAQVRAIAGSVEEMVETLLERRPLRSEGKSEGSWVLLDYGDAIVHVMMPAMREFYNLEAFWGHAERLEFTTSNDGGSQPT